MGGDLNLKKSWHPLLMKNMERVWKEEKGALEERKQIEKLRKEREEERAIEELQRMQEEAGGKKVQKRVDWMYGGPSNDGVGVTEEQEGYLLGKRRIDQLLKKNDAATQSVQQGTVGNFDAPSTVASARDVQSKVAQDPMLIIQKQKMELSLKMAREAQKQAKSEEKERKHRHRHRSRSPDSRHRHRSRSPRREHRHRDRDYRRRSRSPRRRDDDRRQSERRYKDDRRRSRSPRRHSDEHRRAASPRRHFDEHKRSRSPRRHVNEYRQARRSRSPYKPSNGDKQSPKESTADRLAKMQADASSLEQVRLERVRQREAEDAIEQERFRNRRDDGRFASNLRNKATGDMDLGEVMARGRQGFAKEVDV